MPDPRPATPEEAADVRRMHAATRAAWDEAAERYEGWLDEAIELIRAGGSNLYPVEQALIGDLHGRCRRAIHLQCAGGRDTLSLWNLGADEVVGVDYSPRMLDLARRLTAATGAPATWIEADVLDTPHDLDGTADLLYTGRGAILWLQDLDAWAAVLRRLLAPGRAARDLRRPPGGVAVRRRRRGRLAAHRLRLLRRARRRPAAGRPSTSTGCPFPDEEQHEKFARAWTLGEIVTALLGAGLRLERVTEHPVDWWAGHRDVRPEERGRLPLSFSIVGGR